MWKIFALEPHGEWPKLADECFGLVFVKPESGDLSSPISGEDLVPHEPAHLDYP
jgi:hypothetical protein